MTTHFLSVTLGFGRVAHGGATKHILSRMRATGRIGNTSPDEGMQ